ncbi:MAG: thioredoxin family protein [Desulfobacterales bacterium]|jgi:small redox-active disulfide protein 2
MNIKVLGPGCKKCDKTEQIVKEALAEAGVTATVEKVTDMMQIASFGIMSTPAIVVDGDVRLVGKVPSIADVKQMIGA